MRASKPCKRLVLYYHDLLFNTDPTNFTSATVASAPPHLGDYFGSGKLVVFDDPVTKDHDFHSIPAARAQGFYLYNIKDTYNAFLACTLLFNSSEYKGTLNIMGADLIEHEGEELSVVGGTRDFFMARGIVTFYNYFRLQWDIKLYECY